MIAAVAETTNKHGKKKINHAAMNKFTPDVRATPVL